MPFYPKLAGWGDKMSVMCRLLTVGTLVAVLQGVKSTYKNKTITNKSIQ